MDSRYRWGELIQSWELPLFTQPRKSAPEVVKILEHIQGEMTRQSLQSGLNLKDAKHVREMYLRTARKAGIIERTIPDKPQSSKQKYRLTSLGKRMQQDHAE